MSDVRATESNSDRLRAANTRQTYLLVRVVVRRSRVRVPSLTLTKSLQISRIGFTAALAEKGRRGKRGTAH